MGIGRSVRESSTPLMLGRMLWLALMTILFTPYALEARIDRSRLVVVLYPDDNDGRPGTLLFDRGLRSTFTNGSLDRVEIHSEFLDVTRLSDPVFQQHLAEFLRKKYVGRNVELVIAGLATALDFALKHRAVAFPGVPLVFGAVDHREVQARNLPPDVIGVPMRMDLAATLDIALALQPHTRRVFVVAGQARFDLEWEAEARRTFRNYEDRLEFVYLTGLPTADLQKRVAHLPERSILYYLHVFQDGAGKVCIPAEVVELLAKEANAPIYSHVGSYVGRGVVGGRVFSFEAEGKNAARLGLRLLAEEKAESIGVQETSENSLLFDARQLRRWGISEERLPRGSEVRHREPSFWDLYRWHIIGVFSLCVIQALLIVALVVQRASRRRAEQRFRQVVEAAPNGMVMVGQDGRIVLANAAMEKLFGYPREDLLGQLVEMLLPERFRSQHPAQRDRYIAVPQVRLMGSGQVLFGVRNDGSEFPVEIGLSPVRTEGGQFVLASIFDITQRRQAEESLQESQHELRELTGRLLQAQEAERRRLARELHDDLNQNLALLSVQMDLLGQKPPESVAEFGVRVKELSGRVRQMSSSVHDLSHQLHPSKLEQLGLVAAIRGLCKELTQGHGLPIEFTYLEVPESVPEDLALCLYRIIQEALGNVIKHSGARRATVELIGSVGAMCLRVVDDGKGFDPRLIDGKEGLGLVSMRERLRLVHGEVTINSQPTGGTRIDVRVPSITASAAPIVLAEASRRD